MNYTAIEMAKKLDISRSYLYYLKDTGYFKIEKNEKGRLKWNDSVYVQMREYMKKNREVEKVNVLEYKTTKINNRRYLGNKYKLLPFITKIVSEECKNINTVADIFAGTGAVASAFTDRKIITNDIMYSNYICHVAWFSSEKYSEEKIVKLITEYNTVSIEEDNYMSINFANTYFSLEDCRKIGYIREDIENLYCKKKINFRERALLITSLLYAMDKIANTCGHYDAYRQGVEYDKHLELFVPTPDKNLNKNNICFNEDTNKIISELSADLVYIDPPYNSRQYCDAYHLLENVAKWEKPEVFGIAKKMDRSGLKSNYCTKKATEAFEKLIEGIHAKYILLSYNNMANKGNDRSNAKISDADIIRILEKKGKVKIFCEEYKAFTAGKSDIQENQERLFLCECFDEAKAIIPSALNYTGGKYKLLSQLLPNFPTKVDNVVDLFCGGCNVGINVPCNKVLFNDCNELLVGLLNTFLKESKEDIFRFIFDKIDEYDLSLTSEMGYEYYNCDSSNGLGKYNKNGYKRLRKEFNAYKEKDSKYFLLLYILIVYSFNNQIRFNKKGEFNLPVGKRDFNYKMQRKLNDFLDRIKSGDYNFEHKDFRDIKLDEYGENSFFYIDPPYLITCATYNEQEGWTENDERDLLDFLDELHFRNIKFALSNVIRSNGKENTILIDWVNKHKEEYRMIELEYSYANSSYHKISKEDDASEILIVNY